MSIRIKILWPLAVCNILFSPFSYSAVEGTEGSAVESTDGDNKAACQPRTSERHRQGQSLRCKTDPRQSLEQEAEPASAAASDSKCQPRASARHRQGQS